MRLPRLNITYKFIMYLVFFSIIPLLVVSVVSYQTASNILKDEATRYTLELVINERDYLDLQMERVQSLMTNISGVEEITDTLDDINVEVNNFTYLSTNAKIGDILNNYMNMDGLSSIDIFTVGGQHYYVGDTLDVADIREGLKDELFYETLDSFQRIVWIGVEDNVNINSTHEKVIVTAKILRNAQAELIALLLVNYDVGFLYEQLSQVDLGEDAYMIVIDGKGRIIYHPDPTRIGSYFDAKLTHINNTYHLSEILAFDGIEYSVSHAHSNLSNWTIIGLVPIDTLTSKAATIQEVTLIVLVFCFAAVAMIAWLYSRNVVTPIRQVIERFQFIQKSSLDKESDATLTVMPTHMPVRGNDEIAELSSWFNTFMDVLTRRREAEIALQASEARYRHVVGDQAEFVIRWNPNTGVHTFVNKSYCRYLGQSPEELIGMSVFTFIPEEKSAAIRDRLFELVQNLTPDRSLLEMEYEVFDENQNPAMHNWLIRGIFDAQGNLMEVQSVGRNIAERIEAEKQRLALALEKERMQILTNFITKASHEFRTPLSTINSSMYLLKKAGYSSKFSRYIDKVEDQVAAITTLIDAMTTMSRLERTEELIIEQIDICSFVNTIIQKHQNRIIEQDLYVALDLCEGNLLVDGDVDYLQIAIENIIDNAIRYTPPGGSILVESDYIDGHAMVRISDSGEGISQSVLPHIFERFYRGDESHTTRGFGLGLPIAKTIIELHNGTINVTSEARRGTTFTISLPTKSAAQKVS